ncbi:hypothetical protein OF83DRAFT_1172731 [Amylostereum chailletii]|nr:hypothetical protein OF83DRAFT_1172731 [Amylostereum chailletii]
MSAKSNAPAHLLALPSLSSQLSSLPQAKSLANVSLYSPSIPGQHAAQSEAKLKKALSNNAHSPSPYAYSSYVRVLPAVPSLSSFPRAHPPP